MPLPHKFKGCWLVLVILLSNTVTVHAADWNTLAPGIAHMKLSPRPLNPFAHIHAFRIGLTHYQLQTVLPAGTEKTLPSFEQLAETLDAPLIINGGFFTPDFKPLGLRAHRGRQLNAKKKISWWGIFYIKHNQPFLTTATQFKPGRNIQFAIQAGPRLLINRQIPKLKAGLDARSALGYDLQGRILLVATERLALTTTELAEIMRDQLDCTYALNLDGGSSTQLFAQFNRFKKNIRSFAQISDAIAVLPRSAHRVINKRPGHTAPSL